MAASDKQLNDAAFHDAVKLIAQMCQETERFDSKTPEEMVFEGKRKHTRKPLLTVVDYATQGQVYRDFIQNISDDGVFIQTAVPTYIGQELSLTFALPSHRKHIKLTGEVVRISPQGIGVRFKTAKGHQEERNQKVPSERRREKRFQPKVSLFALLDIPFSEMGEIIDISMGGLSFRYISDKALPKGSLSLDLLCVDDGFHLHRLPVKTVAQSLLAGQVRRGRVKFDRLTDRQVSQVRHFIQTHAAGRRTLDRHG
jgi:Tfp pilus assembly protein PilZ